MRKKEIYLRATVAIRACNAEIVDLREDNARLRVELDSQRKLGVRLARELREAQNAAKLRPDFAVKARETADKLERKCGQGPWSLTAMEKGSALAWRSIAERLDGTLHMGSASW